MSVSLKSPCSSGGGGRRPHTSGDARRGPIAVEVPLRFPPGRHFHASVVVREGPALAPADLQLDVHGRHRDGSLREATLVVTPTLEPGERLGLTLVSQGDRAPEDEVDNDVEKIATESVQARFVAHRGGAIDDLVFPELGGEPLLGTIPHGYFDAIEYTPDFYSGHVVALTEHAEKCTDLSPVSLNYRKRSSGPVRIELEACFESAFGPWRKRYRLYRATPRIDVVQDLSCHDARLSSLRLGTITLRPSAWDRSSLRYGRSTAVPASNGVA